MVRKDHEEEKKSIRISSKVGFASLLFLEVLNGLLRVPMN